jgi:large subunit ribosomal protein L29
MKPHEMRDLTLGELQHHVDGLIEELVNSKIKLSVKQLDNPLRVRTLRKEIARGMTILRDKQRGARPGELQASETAGQSKTGQAKTEPTNAESKKS